MYDLIVIGGGPAGLTATMYAIRKRLNVLLVTKELGGKTNFKVHLPWTDEYQVINGLEVVNKFRNELEYLEFARHMEGVEKVDQSGNNYIVTTTGGAELPTKAVIIATGTRQMRLKAPGEKEFLMRGLSYSALSYAPLFLEKTTVVVGDGDLALRATAELATITKKVYLVAKSPDKLITPLGARLRNAQNVEILEGHEVLEVRGDDFARSVVLQDPGGKVVEIDADGIFIEMGLIPNSQMVAHLVKLDEDGRIVIDSKNRTSLEGVFAAGDVTSGYPEQVLIAIGEGAKAALSAYEYLLQKS